MKTEPNEPAFPVLTPLVGGEGLTKREYFAGLAMQGILAGMYSSPKVLDVFITKCDEDGFAPQDSTAEMATSYADALIEELNKH